MTERVAAFEATPQRRRINSRASESWRPPDTPQCNAANYLIP